MSLALKYVWLAMIEIGANGLDVQNTPARYVNGPRPDFHLCAKPSLGEKLTSTLSIAIDRSGSPDEVKLSHTSGDKCLDSVALETARHYRFTPAIRGGNPVSSHVFIAVDFERR